MQAALVPLRWNHRGHVEAPRMRDPRRNARCFSQVSPSVTSTRGTSRTFLPHEQIVSATSPECGACNEEIAHSAFRRCRCEIAIQAGLFPWHRGNGSRQDDIQTLREFEKVGAICPLSRPR